VDVAIDRLYPELFWLDLINAELQRRPPASRATRAVVTRLLGADRAVSTAALAASLLNRGPLTALAVRAASLAYDVKYRTALKQALARAVTLGSGADDSVAALPAAPGGTDDQQPHHEEPIGSRAL
jgi:hypothetical protein